MENVEATIISQYAQSSTLVQLVQNMNQYFDQRVNFQAFYDYVWNVDTAQGFGLDILGRIVGINSRSVVVPGTDPFFGFDDGTLSPSYRPFGEAPFYAEYTPSNTLVLSDDAFRTLILTKALANISATTAPAINQLLQNLFPGRGRAYVSDLGSMQMQYTFEFYLSPSELAILTYGDVLPHPAGVQAFVLQVDISTTFGFAEMGADASPFGSGTFLVY